MIQQFHSWILSKINENINLKGYIYPNVHSNTIYNSQDMETTKVSINRLMDKEDVIYIYKMEYSSAIKKLNFAIYNNMDGYYA